MLASPRPGLWRPGGESGQHAGQATLEPFAGVQVRGLVHHSLQVWVAAAVKSLLQVRSDGGAPLLFGDPGTPLDLRLGQLSGGRTQYVCQDGLYGAASGGRVARIASRRFKGAFVVNQGIRADGRASSQFTAQPRVGFEHGAPVAGHGGQVCAPLARRFRRHVPGEDRVDHAIEQLVTAVDHAVERGRARPERGGHAAQGDRVETLLIGQGDRSRDDLRQVRRAPSPRRALLSQMTMATVYPFRLHCSHGDPGATQRLLRGY